VTLSTPDTWVTLIRRAAAGEVDDRSLFCHRYLAPVRAYIAARWRGTPWIENLDDAVQEVFVECLRERGVLQSYDPDRGPGFRAFLYGVVRNVALRFEQTQVRKGGREQAAETARLRDLAADEDALSMVFDRAWAVSIMEQARERMEQLALVEGRAARRRVEILRLHFEDGLTLRAIAERWQVGHEFVRREYRKAKKTFKASLRQVVAYHCNDARAGAEAECERLLMLVG
jgi:RNA polymerase sigma-70 factor (ECF subfamily)